MSGGYVTVHYPVRTAFTSPEANPYSPYHLIGFGPMRLLAESVPGLKFVHAPGYELADFFMNNTIYMCSTALTGNSSVPGLAPMELFAIIQLPGAPGTLVYNSCIHGKKRFYDNKLDTLKKLDFKFLWYEHFYDRNKTDMEGKPDVQLTYVDWDGMHHSFSLRITELIQKFEHSDYNSKIGV